MISTDYMMAFARRVKRRLTRRDTRRWVDVREAREALRLDPSQPGFLDQVRRIWVRLPSPPSDPWSDEYRQHWLSVYRELTGHDYQVENEAADFDLATLIENPFPYSTKNPQIVGEQLIGIGSLIRAMALPANASVLEMGPGWGNTTLALAQMGYRVTALDIEPKFCRLIEARADKLGVHVETVCSDYFAISNLGRKFDAVLFYESFHHCADHLRLLDEVARVLSPEGRLALAGETIDEALPYPWGINWNGEAIWQIMTNGWFELAFRESYLLSTLDRRGWRTHKHRGEMAVADVYVAVRA
jgi:2-polyprenyl-3-methyl-5-hydroxy-6-metoxy-1,4-benzoquinol methylase